mgnify:CR=1 FL=1
MEEDKKQMLQKCVDYLKERPVYQKLFRKMKAKYEKSGTCRWKSSADRVKRCG